MKFSNKIFIQEAIKLLGFEKKPIDHVIHNMMNEESITTYFDVNVDATEATGYHRHPMNEDDETLYVDGSPPQLIEGPGKKILEADVDGENSISVYKFEHDGNQYCGTDNEGTNLKPIILKFDRVYFDETEFRTYQDVPAYQNKNHEHYAPELDLAIRLHQTIYMEKYGNQSQSREERVSSWLENVFLQEKENSKHQGYEFSGATITRLSSVISDGLLKLKAKNKKK